MGSFQLAMFDYRRVVGLTYHYFLAKTLTKDSYSILYHVDLIENLRENTPNPIVYHHFPDIL